MREARASGWIGVVREGSKRREATTHCVAVVDCPPPPTLNFRCAHPAPLAINNMLLIHGRRRARSRKVTAPTPLAGVFGAPSEGSDTPPFATTDNARTPPTSARKSPKSSRAWRVGEHDMEGMEAFSRTPRNAFPRGLSLQPSIPSIPSIVARTHRPPTAPDALADARAGSSLLYSGGTEPTPDWTGHDAATDWTSRGREIAVTSPSMGVGSVQNPLQ
jgi:hypothetical protein